LTDVIVVEAAVAKTGKYGVPESGDTVEMVERPRGGISVVVVDGQRSGRAAKAISSLVVRKATSLILEGVRDGAAARAASDYLHVSRRGQVSADLVVISADLETRSIVITRNTNCPVLVLNGSETQVIEEPTAPLGTSRVVRPQITELPLKEDLLVVAYTDGVWEAGLRSERPRSSPAWIEEIVLAHRIDPRAAADAVLSRAIELDQGRPRDDMTVATVATYLDEEALDVRRMHVILPIR
jgi:serine phosphatase RsbU (regulator of sigma subunit)